MARHDIVVVGASAGGVTALEEFVRGLPPDLEASIFVVLHMPPWHKSNLPDLLSRWGPLPAAHPEPGEPVRAGRIYVAQPDHHLVFDDGRIDNWRGPKENRHRPSINPLFRSAAVTYGPRVVGVILTGLLDDGAAGLWWVKRFGGIAVVQDPVEAQYSDMPATALQYVEVDHVVSLRDMAGLVVQLARDEKISRETAGGETRQWKRSS